MLRKFEIKAISKSLQLCGGPTYITCMNCHICSFWKPNDPLNQRSNGSNAIPILNAAMRSARNHASTNHKHLCKSAWKPSCDAAGGESGARQTMLSCSGNCHVVEAGSGMPFAANLVAQSTSGHAGVASTASGGTEGAGFLAVAQATLPTNWWEVVGVGGGEGMGWPSGSSGEGVDLDLGACLQMLSSHASSEELRLSDLLAGAGGARHNSCNQSSSSLSGHIPCDAAGSGGNGVARGEEQIGRASGFLVGDAMPFLDEAAGQ